MSFAQQRPSYSYWDVDDSDYMKKAHIDRYAQASRFVSGRVLDLACGYGMGTQMLGAVRGVESVLGIDVDSRVIEEARAHNARENVTFECHDLDAYQVPECDWVVTLETVEHLLVPMAFLVKIKQAARCGVVVSVPIGRTTQKNKYHLHDFEAPQVDGWFQGWQIEHDGRLVQMVNHAPKVLGKIGVYKKQERV